MFVSKGMKSRLCGKSVLVKNISFGFSFGEYRRVDYPANDFSMLYFWIFRPKREMQRNGAKFKMKYANLFKKNCFTNALHIN